MTQNTNSGDGRGITAETAEHAERPRVNELLGTSAISVCSAVNFTAAAFM